jgi:cyanophycin synthetase
VIGVDIASNKDLTKRFLADAAIPVPRGVVVRDRDAAIAALGDLGGAVVVKPLDGNQGKGVSLNLTTEDQVGKAFEIASGISSDVIVEQMFRGRDYRVIVVGGRMVAAAERRPAHVWGDGVHTIQELIDIENQDPQRGADHEKPLTKIKVDPVALAILEKHGRKLDDVPPEADMVLLRESANLSTGGSAKDVTDCVHESVRVIAERAARAIGLDVCGVDLVDPDISQPFRAGAGGIVEVNAAPGIRMHHHPADGPPRDVGAAIVDMLYPAGAPSRIPIVSITGTNGKTTTTRMIGHVLGETGLTVGMTTTDGIWIAGREIARGDMTGPWSAGVVLGDDLVDLAVLETARGGIFRAGLGYDWSDVAVLTNIQLDHIGQDGIETIEDILWIKSLVAQRVREGGTLVLNADDETLVTLPDHPKVARVPKHVVFFSLDPQNATVRRHADAGGTAYVLNGDSIEQHSRGARRTLARASDLPITVGGLARFQIYNAMAALAACIAVGCTPERAVSGLAAFRSDRHNAGRMNLYELDGRYVMLDYGHNPAALREMCAFVRRWSQGKATGVIGLPGDRADSLLRESARVAGCGFDSIIIREDLDLRGRRSGELPELIRSVLASEYPHLSMQTILDEVEAVRAAVAASQPGDIVIAFCEKVDRVAADVCSLGGKPVVELVPAAPQVSA